MMKRSLRLLVLLALTLVIGLVLVSCGHKHSYDKKTLVPTCTEGGYTVYTCSTTLRMLSIRGGERINADVSYFFSSVTDFIFASTNTSISIETDASDRLFYEGTAEQWAATRVYSGVKGTVYFYSETAPTADGNYWHYAEDGVTPIIWSAE